MGAEARLKELGIVLPPVKKPIANYVPYRLAGNLLFLAGLRPFDENGKDLTGKLGVDISIEEGYRRGPVVWLGMLARLSGWPGSLGRRDFILKRLWTASAAAAALRLS